MLFSSVSGRIESNELKNASAVVLPFENVSALIDRKDELRACWHQVKACIII